MLAKLAHKMQYRCSLFFLTSFYVYYPFFSQNREVPPYERLYLVAQPWSLLNMNEALNQSQFILCVYCS